MGSMISKLTDEVKTAVKERANAQGPEFFNFVIGTLVGRCEKKYCGEG